MRHNNDANNIQYYSNPSKPPSNSNTELTQTFQDQTYATTLPNTTLTVSTRDNMQYTHGSTASHGVQKRQINVTPMGSTVTQDMLAQVLHSLPTGNNPEAGGLQKPSVQPIDRNQPPTTDISVDVGGNGNTFRFKHQPEEFNIAAHESSTTHLVPEHIKIQTNFVQQKWDSSVQGSQSIHQPVANNNIKQEQQIRDAANEYLSGYSAQRIQQERVQTRSTNPKSIQYDNSESNNNDFSAGKRNMTVRKRRGRKKEVRARKSANAARAVKIPANAEFDEVLEKPLTEMLQPGGRELNTLQLRKLKDATQLVQDMQAHALEPLTLYKPSQLYDLMASIAEAWKNSGKAAWKKRINKVRENARGRKPPRDVLDANELAEIAFLKEKIQAREEWEEKEKAKLKLEQAKRKTEMRSQQNSRNKRRRNTRKT